MGSALPVPMVFDTREEWFEAIDLAIVELVNEGHAFTADDLRERFTVAPGHSNWWGLAMTRAQTQGLIQHAGFTRSQTKTRNKGVISIWKPKGATSERE